MTRLFHFTGASLRYSEKNMACICVRECVCGGCMLMKVLDFFTGKTLGVSWSFSICANDPLAYVLMFFDTCLYVPCHICWWSLTYVSIFLGTCVYILWCVCWFSLMLFDTCVNVPWGEVTWGDVLRQKYTPYNSRFLEIFSKAFARKPFSWRNSPEKMLSPKQIYLKERYLNIFTHLNFSPEVKYPKTVDLKCPNAECIPLPWW